MTFVDRQFELRALENLWKRPGHNFIVLYGKRRVGKTELIKQFIKDKKALYYLADERTGMDQLRDIGKLTGQKLGDSVLESRGFSDWIEVFTYLKERGAGKMVVAIDEYPYLIKTDASIPSQFQKALDEIVSKTDLMLILSGSSIAMMESEVLGSRSPLYGRRTGDMLVEPLSFRDSKDFFPGCGFERCMEIYAIAGGLPGYLIQLQHKETDSFWEIVRDRVLTKGEFLFREMDFLLRQELREPRVYMSILRAIALGNRKFHEIVNETGLDKTALNKYYGVLNQLKLAGKDVPVTEKNPERSRKALYDITDNYTRFWFRFVFTNRSNLELGNFDEVRRKFDEQFPTLMGRIYEDVAKQLVWEYQSDLFPFERVGKWWIDSVDKDGENMEVDLVAINATTKDILVGEAKYRNKIMSVGDLDNLKRKAEFIDWNRGERNEHYILFSKSGFTENLIAKAKEEGVLLVEKDRRVV